MLDSTEIKSHQRLLDENILKEKNCNLNCLQSFLHFIIKLCFLENTFQRKLDYIFIYNLRSHPPKTQLYCSKLLNIKILQI